MPSFAVRNFGCRANQAEAFAWADAFRERGLRLEEDWGRSDIVVVNSCTLTGRADRDVRKFLRAVARTRPAAKVVVTGCYAERAPAEVAAMPGVAAVVLQRDKDRLPDRVMELAGWTGTRPDPGVAGPEGPTGPGPDAPHRARAYLKVQDGCDGRCAFCVVPSVRGRSRSVRPEEVARSVRAAVERGYREIVLAGIHLSSYGEDLEPRGSLAGLLRRLDAAAGPARLRLSSLDPRRTDGALIACLSASPRVSPHFHLSLQHASARVLGLMGRAAAAGSGEGILEEFRRLCPDAALGADVMVGFPGESEADFDELKRFVERSPLTYVHVFPFSPRRGTPAATRRPLPAAVVTRRATALRRLSAGKDYRFRRRFLGRELEAVVIGRADGGAAEVLTGNFIRVRVPSCGAPAKDAVRVAIGRVLPLRTEGEVVR